MSTEAIYQIKSTSSEDTSKIGELLGKKCKGGEFFILSSDLGGGKTTFTKGLAKGLGSGDIVASPTFTVSNVYKCRDGIEIHHFDFYRLNEGGVVQYELAEIINDPKIVIVVEWGDIVDELLPQNKVVIAINRVVSGEEYRSISISLSEELRYLGVDL